MEKVDMFLFLSDLQKLLQEHKMEIDHDGSEFSFTDICRNGIDTNVFGSISELSIRELLRNHDKLLWIGNVE